jgi:diguanylate cyclase (GGDEF)-like protein
MNISAMLDREGTFTEIVYDIIQESQGYLGASTVSLMQINSAQTKIGTIITNKKGNDVKDGIGDIALDGPYGVLFGEETIRTDSANMSHSQQEVLGEKGIGAIVTTPIVIGDSIAMYYVVIDDDASRVFNPDEVDFIRHVGGIIQELAQRKIVNSSLLSSYELLREILSNIGSGIVVCSQDGGNVLFANDMAQNVDEVRRTVSECLGAFFEGGEGVDAFHSIESYDSQSGLWFEVHFAPLKWLDGSPVIICTVTDITQKKKNQQKIEYQAHNDFLTGLYNRMKCESDLRKIIKKAVAEGSTGAILFIDLDNFKHINDGLGHQYGDVLLQQVAAGLQGISGLRGHCYRMGGDEFIVIVEPFMYERLDRFIENIYDLFNKSWYLMETEYYCTMSMGIAKFPEHATDADELIKKADIAMYEAKTGGKNRYVCYSAGNDKGQIKQLDIENNMRLAVASECDEFVVFYQPVVDAATGVCVSCEALIRWNSKTLGFMGPGEFIPLAEYLGLITSIGDYVLEAACNQCHYWNEHGFPDFRINVNLSVVQLMQKDVVANVQRILEKTGVNPKNIVLEITESFAINDMERVIKIVNGLKKLGPKIALDDFGTGYSSLNYIKQLPFDIIKVDKSFIDDVLIDEYAQAFVKLIVELAKTIGAKICVEGIESKEQYELLAQLGVDYIQGYYFGKPVPMDQFERLNLHSQQVNANG